jgi:hypothetical protein
MHSECRRLPVTGEECGLRKCGAKSYIDVLMQDLAPNLLQVRTGVTPNRRFYFDASVLQGLEKEAGVRDLTPTSMLGLPTQPTALSRVCSGTTGRRARVCFWPIARRRRCRAERSS